MNQKQQRLASLLIIALFLMMIDGTGYFLLNKKQLAETNQNQQPLND